MLTVLGLVRPSPDQWDMVIRGMRNSWESWEKGDSRFEGGSYVLGNADRALALRLAKAGSDHAKYLRQLPIMMEIKAPDYFWREFDTYRVGVEAGDITQNSTSQMHVLGRARFCADQFSFEDVEPECQRSIIEILNWHRDRWIDEGGKRKGPQAGFWRAMKQIIPDSWNYTRTVSLNYANARAIYHARRAHRLAEWRHLCTAFAALPYGELITGENDE